MYKLLIVEDNQVQLESVLTFIEWSQWNITEIQTASNGKEGLSIYEKSQPDIIITDVFMPVMNGIDMTQEIRRHDKNVKIIFISAYEDFNYVKKAMDNQVDAYILKPLKPIEFRESIEHVIKDIAEKNEFIHMQRMTRESIAAFRENFLYSLRFQNANNKYLSGNNLSNLALSQYNSFLIINIEIMGNGELALDFADIFDFLHLIKNSFLSVFDGTAIIEFSSKILVLIYDKAIHSDEAYYNNIIDVLNSFLQEASEKYGVIAAGLSEVHHNLGNIHTALQQASAALENRYALVKGNIYTYEDFEFEELEYSISDIKSEFDLLLENPNRESVDVFLKKYFPEITLNNNAVKSLCFSIITAVQNILIERNHDIKEIFGVSIWDKLENFNTILDARQWIKNILLAVLKFIQNNEQDKYDKIIWDIKDHINKNFNSITNIGQIVSHMYISVSYAKSIFKKYTGQTIFDYLTETRINEAKKLLRNPYIKIYEVCDMIGYKSKNHFTEVFKKYTGMSPRDYQLSHSRPIISQNSNTELGGGLNEIE